MPRPDRPFRRPRPDRPTYHPLSPAERRPDAVWIYGMHAVIAALSNPRREVKRNYVYACAHCGLIARRVRKFHRHTACRECCVKFNGGSYDVKYRFVLVEEIRKKQH